MTKPLPSPSPTDSINTEKILHIEKSLGEVLANNLLNNLEKRLQSTNFPYLYNSILMTEDSNYMTNLEKTFFDIIEIYMIKCRIFQMCNEYNHIMMSLKMIYKIHYNKYLLLDLLVFCINLQFKPPIVHSYYGLYI